MGSVKIKAPEGFKACSRGKECVHPEGPVLPATTEYFYNDKKMKLGLGSWCKLCANAANKKRLQDMHPDDRSELFKKWHENNKEKALKQRRKYSQEYRKKNTEKVSNYKRNWRKKNPEKRRAYRQNRRARKRGLPATFTAEHESFALDYFNGCCAVCGRPLRDLFGEHTVAFDHWIPVSDSRDDNPGTVPENMVPLCHGIDGCNNKKHNRDPQEWLTAEYGKRKANKIIKRINAYFSEIKPSPTNSHC